MPDQPQIPESPEEIAGVQSLFREVNERIDSLNSAFGLPLPTAEWLCECADASCAERIQMTQAEYEAIRAYPKRFPVAHGHELAQVERIVATKPGYLVVEKLGVAGDVAAHSDPRRAEGG